MSTGYSNPQYSILWAMLFILESGAIPLRVDFMQGCLLLACTIVSIPLQYEISNQEFWKALLYPFTYAVTRSEKVCGLNYCKLYWKRKQSYSSAPLQKISPLLSSKSHLARIGCQSWCLERSKSLSQSWQNLRELPRSWQTKGLWETLLFLLCYAQITKPLRSPGWQTFGKRVEGQTWLSYQANVATFTWQCFRILKPELRTWLNGLSRRSRCLAKRTAALCLIWSPARSTTNFRAKGTCTLIQRDEGEGMRMLRALG